MGNPHNGEASFQVEGKTYALRFSADAICQMEDALGLGIMAIAAEMSSWVKDPSRISMKFVRAVFWAGLQDSHPDVDLKAAGDLLIKAGGVIGASALIDQAFTLAFPQAETKGARPRKRVRTDGSGPSS